MLLHHSDIGHHHAAVDGFTHIVNRQQTDLYSGERFHLDTSFPMSLDLRVTHDAGIGFIHSELNRYTGEGERVAKGNQVAGALCRHDRCDAGNAEYVAFFSGTVHYHAEGGRFHADNPARNRYPMRFSLGADIDHMRLSALIEVSQATVVILML